MSGLLSSIGRVFSPVIEGIARVGQAITGVGATGFTAAAATGAAPIASGGLSGFISSLTGGNGVLGHILNGLTDVAASGPAGVITAGAGALPAAAAKGFGAALTGAVDTGLVTAATPTGLAATGATGFGAVGDFLSSENGGNLLAGIGKGIGSYQDQQAQAARDQALYDFKNAQEQRTRDSYEVPANAFAGNQGGVDNTPRPTPGQRWDRTHYRYVRGKGIVEVAA